MNDVEITTFGNRWRSRYGDRFISFPCVVDQLKLKYELIDIKKWT